MRKKHFTKDGYIFIATVLVFGCFMLSMQYNQEKEANRVISIQENAIAASDALINVYEQKLNDQKQALDLTVIENNILKAGADDCKKSMTRIRYQYKLQDG